jgi:chorismate mutase
VAKEWLRSLRADLDRWMSRATSLERELGRTPASRARLGLDIALAKRAFSIVEYARAREEAGLPLYDDDVEEDEDA